MTTWTGKSGGVFVGMLQGPSLQALEEASTHYTGTERADTFGWAVLRRLYADTTPHDGGHSAGRL